MCIGVEQGYDHHSAVQLRPNLLQYCAHPAFLQPSAAASGCCPRGATPGSVLSGVRGAAAAACLPFCLSARLSTAPLLHLLLLTNWLALPGAPSLQEPSLCYQGMALTVEPRFPGRCCRRQTCNTSICVPLDFQHSKCCGRWSSGQPPAVFLLHLILLLLHLLLLPQAPRTAAARRLPPAAPPAAPASRCRRSAGC